MLPYASYATIIYCLIKTGCMRDKQNTEKTRKRPELSNNQNLADSDIWSNVSISEIGCSCTKEVFYTMRCFFPSHIILQMDTHVCTCVMRFISVLRNEKNALYSSLKELTEGANFESLFYLKGLYS